MNNLIQQIEAAQVRAGEAAVIAHLEAQGLGAQVHEDEPADVTASRAAANHLQQVCHGAAYGAGWWTHRSSGTDLAALIRGDDNPVGVDPDWVPLIVGALVSQKLMLSVSELAEAMEGHRKGLKDDKLPHRSMLEVELADTVIRVFDLAGALGMNLGDTIAEKMTFNAHRPDHKPEARAAAGGKSY